MASTVQAVASVVTAVAEVGGVLPTETFLSPENVKEIYKELKEQLNFLRAKKKDRDDEAEKEVITKKTSYEYNDWDQRVINIDFQVTESLLSYKTEIKNKDRWTDMPQRINLGARMNNDIKKIKELSKELTEMRNILVAKEADPVVKISNAPDIKGFETLENPMNTILSLLWEKDVKGIQIHGLLGTGKTTIMQNLNNHGEVANTFQIIIWLKASSDKLDLIGNKKNFSIEELQRDVMQRLNLDDNIAVDQYKRKIWEKLKDKKYLLLLDNAKEDLNIDEIGFPINWEKGSKIILTTRFKFVCPSWVDRSIKVGVLTSKEARRMFSNLLKPKDFSDNVLIMKLMPRVVDWCRCLPLAINIVAGYFKFRDSDSLWRNGLKTLNSWPEFGDDKIKEMCRTFSFCCDLLKGAEKDCFYYGALYPEESNIYKDRLLDCWMAENFLGTKGESGRGKGQCILERLNNLNLLEEDEQKKSVRMHKLIRLVALHNLQTDGKHKCLVLSNEDSLDQQNMDSWEDKNWISMADNKRSTFSDSPNCPVLSTLFLQGNSNLKKFPPSFFKQMKSLRILDLMGTNIESLPESLMNAKYLEVLYLNGCINLLKLPPDIGKLELLEVLDISGSGVDTVPPQIQSLKHLKRLIVSCGAFSEKNIFNVISYLTELHEMLIDTKSEKGIYTWGIIDAVMESVKSLRHMTSLRFRFLHDEVVDVINVVDGVTRFYVHKEDNIKFFVERDEGLDRGKFQVFIGCPISPDVKIPRGEKFDRYVNYCNGKDRSPAFLKLLSKADSLVINNHYDLEHLSEFEFLKSSPIKGCLLEHCKKMKYVVRHCSILSKLERLYLNDLLELESLWGSSIHIGNLPKLKTLKLSRCPKIIKVISQEAVKDIIDISQADGQKPLVFPNLKELVLVDMRNLTSIWENDLLEWPALKKVEISKCPALHHLPFSKDNASKLTSIIAEESWWKALQWTDPEAKQHFHK